MEELHLLSDRYSPSPQADDLIKSALATLFANALSTKQFLRSFSPLHSAQYGQPQHPFAVFEQLVREDTPFGKMAQRAYLVAAAAKAAPLIQQSAHTAAAEGRAEQKEGTDMRAMKTLYLLLLVKVSFACASRLRIC